MKFTGVTRPIDNTGRIVIPKEIRTALNFEEGELIEIHTSEDGIFLKKVQDVCEVCKSKFSLVLFGGHNFCRDCIKKASTL